MDILFKLFLLSITSFDTDTQTQQTHRNSSTTIQKHKLLLFFLVFVIFVCLFVCWYFVQLRLFASKPSSQLRYNEIKDNKEKLKIPQQQQQNIAKKINKTQTERKKKTNAKKTTTKNIKSEETAAAALETGKSHEWTEERKRPNVSQQRRTNNNTNNKSKGQHTTHKQLTYATVGWLVRRSDG